MDLPFDASPSQPQDLPPAPDPTDSDGGTPTLQPSVSQSPKDLPWVETPVWSGFDLLLVTVALLVGTVVFSSIAMGVLLTTPQFRGTNLRAVAEHPSMYIVVPAMGAAYAVMLAVLYLLAVVRQRTFWKSLSWNWPKDWGWLAFLAAGAILAIVAGLLQKILPTPNDLPIEDMFREPGAAWFLATLGVLIAPFVEEVLFRGLLYPVANQWLGDVLQSQQRIRRGRLVFLFLIPWGLAAHELAARKFAAQIQLLMALAAILVTAVVFLVRSIRADSTASRAIVPGLAFLAWGQVAAHLAQRGLVIASFGLLVAVLVLSFLGLRREPASSPTIPAVAFSAVLTAGAFAMVHGQQLAQSWSPLLVLFIVGLVLTFTRAATKSVASSFLIHFGYNLTLFVGLYAITDHFRHMERMVR